MRLEILLPYQVFARVDGVMRIVAETPEGAFGLLPNRLDCVMALTAGILTYETREQGEAYVAVDEGILVKNGEAVLIAVRNAIGGLALGKLREAVEREFVNIEDEEKQMRSVLARLESGFLHRFAEYHRG